MTIKTCELSAPPQDRNDFGELYELLKSKPPNTWLRIPLAELNGGTDVNKRESIRMSLTWRGLRVTTRIRDGYIFVCALPAGSKAVA